MPSDKLLQKQCLDLGDPPQLPIIRQQRGGIVLRAGFVYFPYCGYCAYMVQRGMEVTDLAGVREREPILAPETEMSEIRGLDALLARSSPSDVTIGGSSGESVRLPESIYRLVREAVHELARGNGVNVVSVHAEVTTQEAADLLNVSRPFLVKLLEAGAIPFHYVGTHRRVRFQDLMDYRQERSRKRRAVFAKMAQEAQELGLYE